MEGWHMYYFIVCIHAVIMCTCLLMAYHAIDDRLSACG